MYGRYPMTREASGTSWAPDSTPLQGLNFMLNEWMIMMDGCINAIYDHQGGKRGKENIFSDSALLN